MKISTTAHYGLIAAAYIAEHADEGLVMASTISTKYSIPFEMGVNLLKEKLVSGLVEYIIQYLKCQSKLSRYNPKYGK